MTDVNAPMNRRDLATASKVVEAGRPLIIVVNKADTLPKGTLNASCFGITMAIIDISLCDRMEKEMG